MKVLYYGGQKSGKSTLAEQKALALCEKPYYLATYDNSYGDCAMNSRIQKHLKQRGERFITLEEPLNLASQIKNEKTYLIDCMSMWLLNHLNKEEPFFLKELSKLQASKANIIFVLNNVNEGVIPNDELSRKYVDLTGIIGQELARFCDEVYDVKLGLATRLK